jgi:anti-sigma factor RsiW
VIASVTGCSTCRRVFISMKSSWCPMSRCYNSTAHPRQFTARAAACTSPICWRVRHAGTIRFWWRRLRRYGAARTGGAVAMAVINTWISSGVGRCAYFFPTPRHRQNVDPAPQRSAP